MSSRVATVLLAVTMALGARGAPGPGLALDDAIAEALGGHPTLSAAMLDVAQARADVRAERYRFVPTLLLDGTTTDRITPQLLATGGTTKAESRNLVLGAELRETLAIGTTLGARVEGTQVSSRSPFGAGSGQLIDVGPGYGLSGRLSLTQPLLRGFGAEVGEAELRAALLRHQGARRARLTVASQVIRDVVIAYWELWYAEEARAIERAAHATAVDALRDAEARLAAGASAAVDLHTFVTRAKQLELSALAADATVAQRALSLDRAIGRAPLLDFPTTTLGHDPPPVAPVPAALARARAREASPDVLELQTTVASARDRVRTAAEATRPRLDVVGSIEAGGLGNERLAPVLEQLTGLDNVTTNLGVTMELPSWWARHHAQSESAELAARASVERLRAAALVAEQAALVEVVTIDQALARADIAARVAAVATESAIAQRRRYDAGSALLLEVHEAEDAARRAALDVARARVDAAAAEARLLHVTGALLARYADVTARSGSALDD